MNRLPTVGVAAIFKNEKPYVVEWLAHHRLLGVERFFIADNDSDDGTTELLQSLAACGFLTCHRFPNPVGAAPQLSAFSMLLREHGHEVDWLAFIDADEFIWPMGEERCLPAFLQGLAQRHPDMGALVLNWAAYGSSGQLHQKPGLVVERFTWHAQQDHFANVPIKTVLRPSEFAEFTCSHNALLKPGCRHLHADGGPRQTHPDYADIPEKRYIRSERVCWEGFRVNHYVVKSYQEFDQRKRSKGRAFVPRILSQSYFLWHENDEVQTLPEPAYLERLHAEIDRIEAALAKAGWSAPPAGVSGHHRLPLGGRVGVVERSRQGVLIRGWCHAWRGHQIGKLVAVINGQIHAVQRFEPAPLLDAHKPDPELKGPQRYLSPQAPEGSGFQAFVPLDPEVVVDTLDIVGVTEEGVMTEPLERDLPVGQCPVPQTVA
ncbi:MAG: glycosyltransferase family 2 protein [Thiobacillus sp.]|nr:glycosyltransferase family 2 protein [Thiobacillus sp.]